ncbi:MAG: AraC family transcriptional regulator [Nostoc sp.]|uniref:AraC family transcriptional regulator n=1 Tax=Nostoc sp. TaxID=1180 RepID=UPI002FF69C7C
MTISISRNSFWEIFFEDEPTKQGYDPSDEFDILWQYPSQFGKGYCRNIQLREGLGLLISNYQLRDRLIIKVPERGGDFVAYDLWVSGSGEGRDVHTGKYLAGGAGQYLFSSGGTIPSQIGISSTAQPHLAISVWMTQELFRSFAGNAQKEVSSSLQHLLRQPTQELYQRLGTITPVMQGLVQQILCCPYQGLTKRMYLESKALELMTLLVEEELEAKESRHNPTALKPNDIDRIHHAKNILLENLDNPPSLIELAKQVGLNDRSLKQGFRRVFGTTAFGYLHDYRLEKARQLLNTGEIKVIEVADSIGFASRSYFTAAFKRKFGLSPKEYQMQQKKSV